jgi:putative thioredoxin
VLGRGLRLSGIDVTEAAFADEVIARSHDVPVVVDFWAAWCGPCRMLTPVLERAADEREGQVVLAKVDVDASPRLAAEYGISGIPAVKAFRRGAVVDEFVGARSPQAVAAFFDALAGPTEAERLVEELRAEGRWADVVAAFDAGDHEQALELLLGRLTEDRDRVRGLMVALFLELGAEHPLSATYRRRLSAALF